MSRTFPRSTDFDRYVALKLAQHAAAIRRARMYRRKCVVDGNDYYRLHLHIELRIAATVRRVLADDLLAADILGFGR